MAFHSPRWDWTDFLSHLQYMKVSCPCQHMSFFFTVTILVGVQMRFKKFCCRLQVIPSHLEEASLFSP